ncbi:MAG: hypothetical protein UY39_C0049G0002 [Candidatus Kaiserbacteria bacterium GW2011_GWC2_49_12]|uniref:Uncharacterized protein n=3 Tax=Parcubacteria group TaxID=1794811 RepID=A0A1F5XDD1_9BACT|nr:MAG: hypothetical protein UY06_C0035G0001 [Candidatus Amesbacteria bacterium GW2011_GWA2_47_70]KKW05810.1 MAG: hypothetical protein UY39_C0049G0002 [Candidatus Kaiserbacteria bacterium GW2011_GWC2_49_12]OGF85945.1 MAG: hypothetical protein A2Z63_02835 [Candidatus Giovannonibacteria bacterium RIFCSPLOWO2_02_44_8]OGG87443.1 MAG: hypothetical protein A3H15_03000 [Candidatus Kaiserbacteria bacterium RIFCSPLOWO2_12_FULL_50_28]HCM43532.1 hypothetical protein [Candidatus Kaiserbacteria bacterium]
MLKYFVGIVILVVIAVGGYYTWDFFKRAPQSPKVDNTTPSIQMATSTYATTTFSIVYQNDFAVDDLYFYDQFAGKPIDGVKFTIPLTMATGTTLSSDTYLSIETLPRAQSCSGDIYVVPNVDAREVAEGGTVYSVATTSSAAAGNMYEEQVWAIKDSSPCTAVRYFIHSTDIGNYELGAIREFDRPALLRAFDTLRRALLLKSPQTP